MEIKKNQVTSGEFRSNPAKAAQNMVGEVKAEVGRITWTSKEELITYTQIVVGATFLFGLGIYFVDLIIQSVFQSLHYLLSLIV